MDPIHGKYTENTTDETGLGYSKPLNTMLNLGSKRLALTSNALRSQKEMFLQVVLGLGVLAAGNDPNQDEPKS